MNRELRRCVPTEHLPRFPRARGRSTPSPPQRCLLEEVKPRERFAEAVSLRGKRGVPMGRGTAPDLRLATRGHEHAGREARRFKRVRAPSGRLTRRRAPRCRSGRSRTRSCPRSPSSPCTLPPTCKRKRADGRPRARSRSRTRTRCPRWRRSAAAPPGGGSGSAGTAEFPVTSIRGGEEMSRSVTGTPPPSNSCALNGSTRFGDGVTGPRFIGASKPVHS